MGSVSTKSEQQDGLGRLVKLGLIRELFQQRQISQAQFERLMQFQRA